MRGHFPPVQANTNKHRAVWMQKLTRELLKSIRENGRDELNSL